MLSYHYEINKYNPKPKSSQKLQFYNIYIRYVNFKFQMSKKFHDMIAWIIFKYNTNVNFTHTNVNERILLFVNMQIVKYFIIKCIILYTNS